MKKIIEHYVKIEHIYSEETIENVGNKNRLHAFKEGREELSVVFEWVVQGGTTFISISTLQKLGLQFYHVD